MSGAGIAIVGGGQAGVQAAASLRQGGFDGPLTIVAGEPGLPYQRPPLSKELLAVGAGEQRMPLRPESFYARHDVRLLADVRATAIDRSPASPALTLDSGERLPFDQLVLATGARPRALPLAGADLDGVLALHTHAQALAVRERLVAGARVVVIGGGFIGLEVAAAAAKRGARVTVLELQPRVMARVVLPATSDHFAALHAEAGVELLLGAGAARLLDRGDGTVSGVELADGTVLPADLVVAGIGIVPNDELARAAGIATRDGVLVDRRLRSSDPRVFAIGDCARFATAAGGELRLESVQNATDQGRAVARTLLGEATEYDALPWFWTTQHGCRLQIAGLADAADETVVHHAEEGGFSLLCFRAGRLVAVESVDRAPDHLAARRLLSGTAAISAEQVAAAADLRTLARAAAAPA